jgi:hypothetical protein
MKCACVVLSSVAGLALQYFSTFSHKWHDFLKKKIIDHECFDFIYNFRLKPFLILTRIRRDMINIPAGFHVKYPLFLSDFNET